MSTTVQQFKNFVGGKWVDGDGGTMEVINPATGETIAEVPRGTEADVDRAVEAAKNALPEWLETTPGERAQALLKLADAIEEHTDELAELESKNVGKPLSYAKDEMPVCADNIRFFGREAISFLLLLPIALPGIITGMALNSFFYFAGISFSIWTIVIGHATFCVVLVYNNVLARLRRTSPSLIEASQDLGADGWQTFRFVTWPVLSTALVAGGLLAFALSFDEVIVTTFTSGAQETLPILILDHIERGQDLPVINAVVFVVIVLTVIPVVISQRLTHESGLVGTR